MPSYNIVIALPTADRPRAHAFAQGLGLETPGELADDGVPEPLRVQLNEQTSVMYVPTGGFGWVTADHPTAEPGTSECLLSLRDGQPRTEVGRPGRAGRGGRRPGRIRPRAEAVGLHRDVRRPATVTSGQATVPEI